MKITDSNGEFLEFAGAQKADVEGYSDHLINIYLPEGRELKPNSRRTIALQSFSSSPNNKEKGRYENTAYSEFHFDIVDQVNSYIIIESVKDFESYGYVDVIDQNESKVGEDELMAFFTENVIVHSKNGNHMYFSFKGDASGRTLRIVHQHEARESLLRWIKVGAGFGRVSVFILPVGLLYLLNNNSLDNLSLLVTYSALATTTLFVIRGWLFLQELDTELEHYDSIYAQLVIILITELIVVFIVSFLEGDACLWFNHCVSTVNSFMMAMQQVLTVYVHQIL